MLTVLKRIPTFILLCSTLGLLGGCAGLPFLRSADYNDPKTDMAFVRIPAGEFKMGDATMTWGSSEHPVHSVKVAEFYAGQYEVTFTQYDLFCEATGREKPADAGWGRGGQPVINVSWDDAVAFATWLSQQGNAHYSLPNEAQWEYMARAGTTTAYWSGETLEDGFANCADCGSDWGNRSPAPVGSFPPNPWGLYDTSGNVAEWCADGVHKNYDEAPDSDLVWEDGDTARRMIRGGSWAHTKGDVRPAFRDWNKATIRDERIGFRLVLQAPLPASK